MECFIINWANTFGKGLEEFAEVFFLGGCAYYYTDIVHFIRHSPTTFVFLCDFANFNGSVWNG